MGATASSADAACICSRERDAVTEVDEYLLLAESQRNTSQKATASSTWISTEVRQAAAAQQPREMIDAQGKFMQRPLREEGGFVDMISQALQSEERQPAERSLGATAVGSALRPKPLTVPEQFGDLRYDWSAPSASQGSPSNGQQALLRGCLKLFVESMLQGIILQLRLDTNEVVDGQNIDAIACMSKGLSDLLITVGGIERCVPLSSIRWVRPPEEEETMLSWFLPSDRQKTVVLWLKGSLFVRLRFEREDQAAYFGTCMRLLAKAA
eukprot:TRINITY_DN67969_c0_g1_i1.p1 TRINITY_DN67969_c0_g1~~TRINITY_DN67969_c0_g1_i1.p1  ORF type:complete len:276 (+),score=54.71 TRINITY_DN67969_c0_g1_i1:27-830(+)